jgi:hypothetical protein
MYNIKRWPCKQLNDLTSTIKFLEILYVESSAKGIVSKSNVVPDAKQKIYEQLNVVKAAKKMLLDDPSRESKVPILASRQIAHLHCISL